MINNKLGHIAEAKDDLWNALMLNPELVKNDYWTRHSGLFQPVVHRRILP